MKYKCTDCGQEYDAKPEFCDCGNNVFEEIIDKKVENLDKIYPQAEFKPEFPKKRNLDILSVLVFIICIILSILSWIFIGKDTENIAQNTTEEPVIMNAKEIPSIDKLWKEKSLSVLTITPQPIPEPTGVKVVGKKPEKTVQNVSKPRQTAQAKTATQQPKSTMTEEEKQAIIKKLTTKSTPAKTVSTTVQRSQESAKAEVKTEINPEVKVPDTAQLNKELGAYKIALRNRLGKSINFAAVIGDGRCVVTFKIDRTGNLIERKFSVQSKNNSLNDAVYAAILGNPTFKEPPEGYKGETLTLTVTMNGGNFEVKLN